MAESNNLNKRITKIPASGKISGHLPETSGACVWQPFVSRSVGQSATTLVTAMGSLILPPRPPTASITPMPKWTPGHPRGNRFREASGKFRGNF